MSLDALDLVLKRSRSTGAARLVLVVLAYHADRTSGHAYASRRLLALEANLSTSTVHAALHELLALGDVEIVMTGSGRKATTYRICSGLGIEPLQSVDNSVVARFEARSGSIHGPVVARSTSSSIGGTEDLNKIEPETAAAPIADDDSTADAVVVRSANSNGVPQDARAGLAALKASMTAKTIAERQAEQQRLRELLGPPGSEPDPAPPTAAGSDPAITEPGSEPTPAIAPPAAGTPADGWQRADVEPPRRPGKQHRRSQRRSSPGRRGREPPRRLIPVRHTPWKEPCEPRTADRAAAPLPPRRRDHPPPLRRVARPRPQPGPDRQLRL